MTEQKENIFHLTLGVFIILVFVVTEFFLYNSCMVS